MSFVLPSLYSFRRENCDLSSHVIYSCFQQQRNYEISRSKAIFQQQMKELTFKKVVVLLFYVSTVGFKTEYC